MKKSAGLLIYRQHLQSTEVFLVHPGGPFWKTKDAGSWSIPKGEFTDEAPLLAAKREFFEETGQEAIGHFKALAPIRQSTGKVVYAFAVEMNFDEKKIVSNNVEMIWPPHSGRQIVFPEIDKGEWFDLDIAREKIIKGQVALINELVSILE